ncbi:GGDEF domain-containing protein [Agrilutibacter solisilvae]|uniref:diguanylate cyclase n=1 Tax=Agrilutibacter solisilvae TaxID=2763317 RepID=A0A974Y621_9GAMM|nr:GGDEF domain-containing protein [Lysobacter solisilvae]QSX79261.1 GGDEF domain-containing protein [Lysobacter solisilvae]
MPDRSTQAAPPRAQPRGRAALRERVIGFWMRRSMRNLSPLERQALTHAQVAATRPIVSGVIGAGAMILSLTGLFEAVGLVPGIGYAWWLVELAALTVGALAAAVWLLEDWRVRLVLTLLSTVLIGVFMSVPLPGTSSQLALRTALFHLWPIALLALLARPTSILSMIAVLLGLSWWRVRLHGDPSSGSALYWLYAFTSIGFGLLLAGYKTDFAVAVFRMQARLRRQAVTDELTGLFNRVGWNQDASAAYAAAARRGHPVSLVFFDIDHFKAVNDRYGHDTGDRVLQQLGRLMKSRAGANTWCARLGGEEFVTLFVGHTPDAVEGYVQRVRREFEEGARDQQATVSAGVAHREPGEGFSQHLRRADQALYAAKQGGRNAMVVSQV